MPSKLCPACATAQPLFAFYRDSTKADGLRAICKTCTASRQAGSGAKRREINARYYAANKDRLKAAATSKPRPARPKRSAFIGPPTQRQHAAALASADRRLQRRTDEAERVQAAQTVPAIPAPPATPKPTEADLAARKAAALAKAAELAALMRAPARA